MIWFNLDWWKLNFYCDELFIMTYSFVRWCPSWLYLKVSKVLKKLRTSADMSVVCQWSSRNNTPPQNKKIINFFRLPHPKKLVGATRDNIHPKKLDLSWLQRSYQRQHFYGQVLGSLNLPLKFYQGYCAINRPKSTKFSVGKFWDLSL